MKQPRPQAERTDALWIRARMIQAIRSFFIGRGYLEVETPHRIPTPIPEEHIDAVRSEDWFLHPSPELCMKRLLAAGHPRIFQICRCFRDGERGSRHLPEFTMLEWYRRGTDYRGLMEECEEMISGVAGHLNGRPALRYRNTEISLHPPWERLTVAEAFRRYAPLSAGEALRDDRFDELLAIHIEPHLGKERPTILYDYPAALGSLARLKREAPTLAERFEIYIGGLELANGFSELNDEAEQRRRFLKTQQERRGLGKATHPIPEKFLQDLLCLPDSAGIAFGIDRLAMLFTDAAEIDAVSAWTPEEL
jgi:elongation factor P--(R)-beta-lysine ligase